MAENDFSWRKSWWWVDFLSKEIGKCCFIIASDKNTKDQKNLQSKLNQSIIAQNRTITKQRTLKYEANKTDQNPPITNYKPCVS